MDQKVGAKAWAREVPCGPNIDVFYSLLIQGFEGCQIRLKGLGRLRPLLDKLPIIAGEPVDQHGRCNNVSPGKIRDPVAGVSAMGKSWQPVIGVDGEGRIGRRIGLDPTHGSQICFGDEMPECFNLRGSGPGGRQAPKGNNSY